MFYFVVSTEDEKVEIKESDITWFLIIYVSVYVSTLKLSLKTFTRVLHYNLGKGRRN